MNQVSFLLSHSSEHGQLIISQLTNSEWHDVTAKSSVHDIIGHISALLFYGPELSNNKEWLEVTEEYTSTGFLAARELRLWPQVLQPFIHWFLPSCRRLRYLARRTRGLIQPVIAARQRENARRASEGQDLLTYDDAIEWTERAAKGRPYDAAMSPLLFSINALHTTTDLLTQVLLDLSTQPHLIEALRQEFITVIPQQNGWKNTSISQLVLMDSVIKESQRLKPTESSMPPLTWFPLLSRMWLSTDVQPLLVLMRRYAMHDITLADGTQIPRGTVLGIPIFGMRDPEIYPDPDTYDGYRFMKMREQPGFKGVSQLVETSPMHLGFGHGIHACPGRFLAATQVKIVLSHMVMKYDFKLAGTLEPKIQSVGIELISDSEATLAVRRRKEQMILGL
jgi:cytochrome P450